MGVRFFFSIFCDRCSNFEDLGYHISDVKGAEDEAWREYGYREYKGQWLCPDCVKELNLSWEDVS